MTSTPHRIRRLRWQVSESTESAAFARRAELRAMQAGALPAMARAFDSAVVGDATIRLERLDVRIRVDDLHDLEAVLEKAVQRELADQTFATQPALPDGDAASQWIGAHVLESVTGDYELLVHYLLNGALPWHAAGGDRDDSFGRLRQAAAGSPEATLARAPHDLASAAVFFQRWLQLLPASAWPNLARALERRSSASAGLPDVVSEMARDGASWSSGLPGRQGIVALMLAVGQVAHDAGQAAVAAAAADAASAVVQARGDAASGAHSLTREWLRVQQDRSGSRQTADRRAHPGDTQPPARSARAAVPAAEPSSVGQNGGSASTWANVQPPASAAVITVSHAGLVLLHPFLPRLFERTGLLTDRSIPEALRPRAAALLCYAATGVDDPFEFELPLVKVLLGLSPDTPVPVSAGLLQPEDTIQVAELLDSVIEHWTALKKTSIEGLRAAFLSRPGLLGDLDTGWQLRVEPLAFDVLLTHLPWGIGTIVLPWMKRPIFTDWPTSR